MTTYSELDALLHSSATGKPVPSRKIGNNTYAQRRDHGAIAVRLHNTDVLTFTPKQSRLLAPEMTNVELAVEVGYDVTIHSGGWLTITTKDRINDHLIAGFRVDSDNGRWRLLDTVNGEEYWYLDGIKIHVRPNRTGCIVTGFMVADERERVDRHNRQMSKLIDRYLKGWTDDKHVFVVVDAMEPVAPCALCILTDDGLIGERMGDVQHLIEHLMERVVPRSVWVRALEATGYKGRAFMVLRHRTLAMQALRKYLRGQLYIHHVAARRSLRAA